MGKGKLPRGAIEDFADTCKLLGEMSNLSTAEVIKHYLSLMEKYSAYFFDTPWTEKYDYPAATTFTEVDNAFLNCPKEEYENRYWLMLIKKNMWLNGFMGMGMLIWTPEAYREQNE
jgi:hypothetical protein